MQDVSKIDIWVFCSILVFICSSHAITFGVFFAQQMCHKQKKIDPENTSNNTSFLYRTHTIYKLYAKLYSKRSNTDVNTYSSH